MSLEIYLDMDGVCTDFISAALTANGVDAQLVLERWATEHPGEFHAYEVLDMPRERFWRAVADQGEDFWADLTAYPWFEELRAGLSRFGSVLYCTAPTGDPACIAGKLRWLQRRHGRDFRDFVITTHKERVAHSRAVLIDDYSLNTDRFIERGGHAILFPQCWNDNAHIEDRMAYVTDRIARIAAQLQN